MRIVAPDLLAMAVGKRDIRVSTGKENMSQAGICMMQS